jgi:DNA-binding MarR family transcriptional regulator
MVDPQDEAALRRCIELFYFAYREFTAGPDRVLEQRGLGRVHHRILYFVAHNPDIAVSALLEILGVSKQALNAPLRQLIEMKLVTAAAAGHDRRYKLLRLSDTGRRLEAKLTGSQMKRLGEVFAAAGDDAQRGWQAVMEAMTASR